ncbi:MAG: diguanylate cyclase [Paucimonas sp.]|nr:diguanylate cyclase [Paucimonas sp.]
MPRARVASLIAQTSHKAAFLHGRVRQLLAWPLACGLLAFTLWSVTENQLAKDRTVAERGVQNQATALARSYAEQLNRSTQLLDQITMSIQYYWETTGGRVELEEQRQRGLFPNSSLLYVNIFGPQGEVKATTVEGVRRLSIGDRPHFLVHKNALEPIGLGISDPLLARMTGRPIVSFSRALRTADGGFGGIVSISVEPAWLVSYYDLGNLNKRDVLLVRKNSGTVLAETVGREVQLRGDIFRQQPDLADASGMRLLDASHFTDATARYVAWMSLPDYPLTALVAISATEAMAPFEASSARHRNMAWAATGLLALLALVGMGFTARLAWRRHQGERARALYGISVGGGAEAFYLLARRGGRQGHAGEWEIIDCNERAAEMYRARRGQLVGRKLSSFFSGPAYQTLAAMLEQTMQQGSMQDDYQVPPGSQLHATWVHRRFTRTEHGVALMLSDIGQRKAHEAALSRMATTDELTGLPNRQWLNNYLPEALARARQRNGQVALLFLDLDDFKNVNDTLGHDAGDELLKAAALRLRAVIRPHDHAVRLGGDEFTAIIEGISDEQAIAMVADRIGYALGEPYGLGDGRPHHVHASVGVALFPQDGEDAATLLKHADIAMYAAKARGKSNWQFFKPHLSDALVERLAARQAMRDAIGGDQFTLSYQPRVDCYTGTLCGFEALLHWQHPQRGLLDAKQYLPVAEEAGLVGDLGRLAIAKACRQLAQWRDEGVAPPPLSVNIAPRQFRLGGVLAALSASLAEWDLPASLLEIEMTESSLMEHARAAAEELATLRELGVRLLVDDFGTGFSSLSMLQTLQVNAIKVDSSFTARLNSDQRSKAFYQAMVSMAHVLELDVVADGVETAAQLRLLQELQCNQVQGPIACSPVNADAVPALVRQHVLLPAALIRTRAAAAGELSAAFDAG